MGNYLSVLEITEFPLSVLIYIHTVAYFYPYPLDSGRRLETVQITHRVTISFRGVNQISNDSGTFYINPGSNCTF